MAKPYTINIVNGQGSENVLNGQYSVTASVNGYDNTTIDPNSLNIVEGTNSYTLSIEANGTLTVHVSEDGTSLGTAITGATFYRTNSQGTEFGSQYTTDSNGNITIEHVPYASSDTPSIFIKQTASDGNHDFSLDVIEIKMTTQTYTKEIKNALPTSRTFILTDKHYNDIPISSGSIILN